MPFLGTLTSSRQSSREPKEPAKESAKEPPSEAGARDVSASKDSADRPSYGSSRRRSRSSKDRVGSNSGSSTKDTTPGRRNSRHRSRVMSRATTNSGSRARSNKRTKSYGVKSSLSESSGGSRYDDSDSSGSDEWNDEVLDSVPGHLRKAVPLHLREAVIMKHGATSLGGSIDDDFSVERGSSKATSVASRLRKQGLERKEMEPAPVEAVLVSRRPLRTGCCVALAWVALAISLLIAHAVRYYSPVGEDLQRLMAENVFMNVTINATATLAPAFSVVRAVMLGASAGLFNTSQPFQSIARTVVAEMERSRSVQEVHVVGATENILMLRSGQLHNVSAPAPRRPLVYTMNYTACSRQHPLACLESYTSPRELRPLPGHSFKAGWVGPKFLPVGPEGQELDPADWPLAEHLLAYANPHEIAAELPIGVDVVVDLGGVAAATRTAVPYQCAIYVCTSGGVVLAGSQWQPQAAADRETGNLVYPYLWDLPLAWVGRVTPSMVAGSGRSEAWHGRDLVVVQPLVSGDTTGGAVAALARPTLRVVVYTPRDTAVKPLLGQLAIAALAIAAAPFAFCVIALLMGGIHQLVSCCRRYRRRRRRSSDT